MVCIQELKRSQPILYVPVGSKSSKSNYSEMLQNGKASWARNTAQGRGSKGFTDHPSLS